MRLFANPAVLLAFYDPHFHTGAAKIFPWQVRVHEEFAARPQGLSKEVMVVAPNGSGKSSVIMSAPAIWTAMSFTQSRSVITSSSIPQLDMQTMPAVKRLAGYINQYHGAELWEIQHRYLHFKPNGSEIIARKSDEEGTMEGFHPIVPGGEFSILVDEGKSISDPIYAGILKWTGFTRRMDVTSAGDPSGAFHRNWQFGAQEKFLVTADDCPNITEADKQRIITEAGGPDSPLAQQILWSRFVALAGSVVINLEILNRCMRLAKDNAVKHKEESFNRGGLDLSGGGDEYVMSVWNGNKQVALEAFRFKDTTMAVEEIIRLTRKWKLTAERRRADAGGVGKPILDTLANRGYPWIRIHNQARPNDSSFKNWGNRGTQMWFHFGRLVEDCAVILMEDEKQKTQLANRYYVQQKSTDKIIVEPKAEARSQGRPSPDRADATVLAMSDYRIEEELQPAKRATISEEELEEWYQNLKEGKFDKTGTGSLTLEHIAGARRENSLQRRIRVLNTK